MFWYITIITVITVTRHSTTPPLHHSTTPVDWDDNMLLNKRRRTGCRPDHLLLISLEGHRDISSISWLSYCDIVTCDIVTCDMWQCDMWHVTWHHDRVRTMPCQPCHYCRPRYKIIINCLIECVLWSSKVLKFLSFLCNYKRRESLDYITSLFYINLSPSSHKKETLLSLILPRERTLQEAVDSACYKEQLLVNYFLSFLKFVKEDKQYEWKIIWQHEQSEIYL